MAPESFILLFTKSRHLPYLELDEYTLNSHVRNFHYSVNLIILIKLISTEKKGEMRIVYKFLG